MAPFTPFIAEKMYLLLTNMKQKESVHLEDYPRPTENLINDSLEQGVGLLEEILLLARNLREKEKVKVRIPLKTLAVVHRQQSALDSLKPLEDYLKSELNVREIQYNTDEQKFVKVQIKPNSPVIGPRAGKRMKTVTQAIMALSFEELQKLDEGQSLTVDGDFKIGSDCVRVQRDPVKGDLSVNASAKICVALDLSVDRDQQLEGLARETVNRIQNLRKDSGLQLDNRIHLQIVAKNDLREAIENFENYISEQTLATKLELVEDIKLSDKQNFDIDGEAVSIGLQKVS
jgi:isoleucyl-tRNA synthetase